MFLPGPGPLAGFLICMALLHYVLSGEISLTSHNVALLHIIQTETTFSGLSQRPTVQ